MADAAPVVVGLKAICKVHVAPEANVVVQVLATISNSPALAPEKVKELTDIDALLVLLKVMVWGADVLPTEVAGKVSVLGENAAVGRSPEPERVMVCGELIALSVINRLAVAAAEDVGLKAIER